MQCKNKIVSLFGNRQTTVSCTKKAKHQGSHGSNKLDIKYGNKKSLTIKVFSNWT